jgi:hypothetical protein
MDDDQRTQHNDRTLAVYWLLLEFEKKMVIQAAMDRSFANGSNPWYWTRRDGGQGPQALGISHGILLQIDPAGIARAKYKQTSPFYAMDWNYKARHAGATRPPFAPANTH